MLEIGVDIEDISRFEKYSIDTDIECLSSIFTERELQYCYSKKLYAKHLAVRFCAKEAFTKAISDVGININFNEIEVLNKPSGKPYLNLPENLKDFITSVSLSHNKTKAIASVIVQRRAENDI